MSADDLGRLSLDTQQDRATHRRRLEDLRRDDRAERVLPLQRHERRVRRRQEARHVALGDGGVERDIAQPLGLPRQRLGLTAIPDEQEVNVRIADPPGGPEDEVEPVGHAERADIGDHELALVTQRLPQCRVRVARPPERQVDAVGDDLDLAGVDAARGEIVAECGRDGDHPRRAAIEAKHDALEQPEDHAVPAGADRRDRFGPDVAQLEHPGLALAGAERAAAPGGEELRRGRDDHVALPAESRPETRPGEAEIVQHPLREAGIGRHVGAYPDHLDAVHHLARAAVAVAGIDAALREIGRAGDDGHLCPRLHPAHGMLVGARGGRIHLRREIVGQEEDAHRSILVTNRPVKSNARHAAALRRPKPVAISQGSTRTPDAPST